MKVDSAGINQFRFKSSKKNKPKQSGEKTSFNGILDNIETSHSESPISNAVSISDKDIQEVVESIQILGKQLLHNPSVDTVASYKQAVRNFLKSISRQAFSIEEHMSRRDIVNQKKYFLIRRVNESLDSLSREIFTGQKKQINILSKIEEIQGLLVNLIHVE